MSEATQEPVRALEAATTAEAAIRVPTPSAGRSRWALAGLPAAAFVVSLWIVWHGSTADIGRRVVWLDLDVGSEVSQPAIAPDGTTLVFIASGRLVVRRLDQAKIRPLAGTEGASSLFFHRTGDGWAILPTTNSGKWLLRAANL